MVPAQFFLVSLKLYFTCISIWVGIFMLSRDCCHNWIQIYAIFKMVFHSFRLFLPFSYGADQNAKCKSKWQISLQFFKWEIFVLLFLFLYVGCQLKFFQLLSHHQVVNGIVIHCIEKYSLKCDMRKMLNRIEFHIWASSIIVCCAMLCHG